MASIIQQRNLIWQQQDLYNTDIRIMQIMQIAAEQIMPTTAKESTPFTTDQNHARKWWSYQLWLQLLVRCFGFWIDSSKKIHNLRRKDSYEWSLRFFCIPKKIRTKKKPWLDCSSQGEEKSGDYLLSQPLAASTIGDEGLDFWVRDGIRYFPLSMVTRKRFLNADR